MQYEERLRGVIDVLRKSLQLGDEITLGADTILLEDGLTLDSVAVLELLLGIEARFGFQIEEHEVTDENLHSVGSLVRLIGDKLGAAPVDDA